MQHPITLVKDPITSMPLHGSNSSLARSHNERLIIHSVRLNGTLSRKQIADLTMLSTPTISSITAELLDQGILKIVGREHSGKRGQPSICLSINPDYAWSVGAVCYEDKLYFSSMDFSGGFNIEGSHFSKSVQSYSNKGAAALDFINERKLSNAHPLIGIGSHTGFYSDNIKNPETVASLDHQDFKIFQKPSSQCAALAELMFGHGSTINNFIYLWLGEHISTAIVMGGEIFEGLTGMAGDNAFKQIYMNDNKTSDNPIQNEPSSISDSVNMQSLKRHLASKGFGDIDYETLPHLSGKAADITKIWLSNAAEDVAGHACRFANFIDLSTIVVGSNLGKNMTELFVDALNNKCQNVVQSSDRVQYLPGQVTEFPDLQGAAFLPIYSEFAPVQQKLQR